MRSDVFFAQRRATQGGGLLDKIGQLFEAAGFSGFINEGDLVAIKTNFGERGNTTAIRPEMVKRIVQKVKKAGGDPFLTDSNSLEGDRLNAPRHLRIAADHGFTLQSVEAPIVIADGLTGNDCVPIAINQKHFNNVPIGSVLHHADSILVVNHFTGHPTTGYCGVINNLATGSSSRHALAQFHSEIAFEVSQDLCKQCGRCQTWCPHGAINESMTIDMRHCKACGDCVAVCHANAIEVQTKTHPEEYQEKMVETFYAATLNKRDRIGYFNFLIDITPDSDSWTWSDAPVVGDIGIIASRDPVALEQASIDFFSMQPIIPGTRLDGCEGRDRLKELSGGIDWEAQLRYAEKLGLGSRDYELFII